MGVNMVLKQRKFLIWSSYLKVCYYAPRSCGDLEFAISVYQSLNIGQNDAHSL